MGDLRASFEDLRAATVAHYMERRTAAPESEPEDSDGPSVIPLHETAASG